jgi:hypothetical protein
VLAVVSVVGFIVVPSIEIVRYRMDGAVRGYAMALVAAQRLAVKQQHDVVLAFDTFNGRLRIHQDSNNNGAMDPGEAVRHVPLDDGVVFGAGSAPPLAGAVGPVTFTERQGGLPAFRFTRSGSASEEGTFYLTSERDGARGGHAADARSLHVDRATGRVTWFYFAAPSWVEGF